MIRNNIKQLIKKILNNNIIQDILCFIIFVYMYIVYITSNIIIRGDKDKYIETIIDNKPNFIFTWHGRIFIAPVFVKKLLKKNNYNRQPFVLSSKHKDGKIASKTMKLFNFKEIFGSTINKKKLHKAADSGAVKSIMTILKTLKNGGTVFLAPDGPRGPERKINSEIVNIAKKTNATIFPVAISYSLKKQLESWDKFQIPLPFGTIIIDFLKPVLIDKTSDFQRTNELLELKMNIKVDKNDKFI